MLKAVHLRCEYLENPVGIDRNQPKLSWYLEGDGKYQSAYEIVAAHTREELDMGNYIWNSGKVASHYMVRNPYDCHLVSRERIYWKVRIWDESEQVGDWSETALFEMGLLERNDWKAAWISGGYLPNGQDYPVDEFRRQFQVDDVQAARLYITACGLYEARINGKKTGEQIFAPGLTTYEKRLHYQVIDVTDLLQAGENVLDISLGNGWFRGKLGVFGAKKVFGDTTCVLAQLEWTDHEGNGHCLTTDESFAWCNDGPIRFNDMKDGEDVDRRYIPSYQGKARKVKWETEVCCSNNVPVLEKERFTPKVLHTPDGSTVLDFGQNIAGYVEFSIQGTTGHTASMVMGEMLDEEGNFTLSNLVMEFDYAPDYCDYSRFQTYRYTCGSDEREFWKPKFAIQGFRYVKLENWPEEVLGEHFCAIAIYSDMEETASFQCSSKELEQLVHNTLWSIKGNFLDVPTDCPTRERAAWSGDAQLFFNTGCYFYDFTAFFRKWLRDMYDDQAESGLVYNIVPRVAEHAGMNNFVEGSSGWTDAGILIPYRYWKRYGDIQLVEELYEPMKKLLTFLTGRMGDTSDPELDTKLPDSEYRKYVVTCGFHFGEWNEPNKDEIDPMLPEYEEATAYLCYSLTCMAEMAEALGMTEDAKEFGYLAGKVREAYQYYFVENNAIQSERMCKYVRPLALNLLDEDARENVEKQLIHMVRERNHHVGTGFLSTPFILKVLSDAGYTEDAYKMLEKDDFPSWIYEIRQGATTIWESWNGDCSRNHYSNGVACDWIFNTITGIQVVGERKFYIAPHPGGSLQYAAFTYQSIYGSVSSSWKKEGQDIVYEIQIPVGCEAVIELPGKKPVTVEAGSYCRKM